MPQNPKAEAMYRPRPVELLTRLSVCSLRTMTQYATEIPPVAENLRRSRARR